MIRKLLVKVLVSALALWAADALLSGFSVSGGIMGYLVAGVALGLLNTLVRPVLKLIAAPLIFVTLGLFTLVINAAMLWLASSLTGVVTISGTVTLVLATVIVSLALLLLNND